MQNQRRLKFLWHNHAVDTYIFHLKSNILWVSYFIHKWPDKNWFVSKKYHQNLKHREEAIYIACFNWSTDESWFHWLVFILKSMLCNFTWQVDLFHCIWIITLFFFLIWIIILEKKNNFQAFPTRILSYRQKNPNESCE